MVYQKIVGMIVLILALIGSSFWGGMQYQKNMLSSSGNGSGRFGPEGNAGGGRGPRGNGGFVSGKIIGKDATSITIELQQGGTRIILYSPQTNIGKAVSGSANDGP